MSKWSKAAKLVNGVRDGLALLDDDERRRAIEALRSIVYEDMFGTGSQELLADACVRCGSISIIRRGHTKGGNQRWYCKDCGRTFTANVGRVLGMSKLPVETWMTYVEAFIDQLPLRDCMDKCGVGLRTAWFMRRRIIECIQRYNPSFNAVAGDRVEIDETYFRDSYKGYRRGTMPRPARKSGRRAAKRGLSKQQVCVVTGIDDTGASSSATVTQRRTTMKIEMRPVTIRELIDQYVEDEDTGEVRAYGGKLDVRPKYQREFVYDTKDSEAVIHTVLNGFPLNTMYWVEREDGSYEVLDGQQRTISICRFATNTAYSVRLPDPSGKGYNSVNYPNLFDNQREDFLNYPLQVYFCSGTEKEKMDWFQTINIAGKALKKQEIRNAVYASPWLTDAKSAFSRRNCAAHKQYGKYLSGECLRQDYLETILEWAASRDNITSEDVVGTYMQQHRNDDNADPLWDYCERIFGWVRKTFGNTTRKEMKGLPWGIMYNEHHEDKLDPKDVQNEVDRLMADGEVQSKKGIYEYVLDGKEKHLSLRTFDDADKRTAYEKQQGICPLCHNHFEYEEMAGDHIKPWSKGGKTIPENCQMLCIPCNTGKSNH